MQDSEFRAILKRLTKKAADAKKFQKRLSDRMREIDSELESLRATKRGNKKG